MTCVILSMPGEYGRLQTDLAKAIRMSEDHAFEEQAKKKSEEALNDAGMQACVAPPPTTSARCRALHNSLELGAMQTATFSADPRPRLRQSAEQWARPVGLVNNGNTCWLNSIMR